MNEKITNPVKAIRAKCLDCCCGSAANVKLCDIERCPLFAFRFGKNPYRSKRTISEEQRQAFIQRMKEKRNSIDSINDKNRRI